MSSGCREREKRRHLHGNIMSKFHEQARSRGVCVGGGEVYLSLEKIMIFITSTT